MHNDKDLVRKYMKSICIGAVQKDKKLVKQNAKDKVSERAAERSSSVKVRILEQQLAFISIDVLIYFRTKLI